MASVSKIMFQDGENVFEPNASQLAQYKLDQEVEVEMTQQKADNAIARAALLERLGITADEAALLLR